MSECVCVHLSGGTAKESALLCCSPRYHQCRVRRTSSTRSPSLKTVPTEKRNPAIRRFRGKIENFDVVWLKRSPNPVGLSTALNTAKTSCRPETAQEGYEGRLPTAQCFKSMYGLPVGHSTEQPPFFHSGVKLTYRSPDRLERSFTETFIWIRYLRTRRCAIAWNSGFA